MRFARTTISLTLVLLAIALRSYTPRVHSLEIIRGPIRYSAYIQRGAFCVEKRDAPLRPAIGPPSQDFCDYCISGTCARHSGNVFLFSRADWRAPDRRAPVIKAVRFLFLTAVMGPTLAGIGVAMCVWNARRRLRRGRCPACGYMLAAGWSDCCTECGLLRGALRTYLLHRVRSEFTIAWAVVTLGAMAAGWGSHEFLYRVHPARDVIEAAQWGRVSEIRRFVAEGADVHRADVFGLTPLHYAAMGHDDAIDVLLDAEPRIDSGISALPTPLHAAILFNSRGIVNSLLEAESETDRRRDDGPLTCLEAALASGDEDMVRIVLEHSSPKPRSSSVSRAHRQLLAREIYVGKHGIVNWELWPRFSQPVLESAANEAGIDLIEMILVGGYAPDCCADGDSPLRMAVSSASIDSVSRLLKAGADPNACGNPTELLYDAARSKSRDQLVRMLFQGGVRSNEALESAARAGGYDLIAMLVENGAEVNFANGIGKTPLHQAANYPVARKLIDHGADVSAVDAQGWTPLHDAVYAGRTEVVNLLVSYGACPSVANLAGQTPLSMAQSDGREDIKFIFEYYLAEHGPCGGGESQAESTP